LIGTLVLKRYLSGLNSVKIEFKMVV